MYYINVQVESNVLKDSASPEDKQLEIFIIATHTDVPINNRLYIKTEVLKQINTWIQPYPAPILLSHDDQKDPVGRIVEQKFLDVTELAQFKTLNNLNMYMPREATGAVILRGYILDDEQIKKIEAGLYKTVSVGFSCDKLICSICGQEECEHIQGETYDGVVAYRIPIDMRYHEVSFVNIPADEYAGLVQFRQIPKQEASEILTNNLSVQQNINKQFVKQSVNSHSENLDDDFSQVHKYSTDEQGGNLKMENAGQVETTDFKKQYDDLLSEHNELKKHFDELKHSYEKLQKTLDNLLQSIKNELVDQIVYAKTIILDEDSDEFIEKNRQWYLQMDVEQLRILKDEFSRLLDQMLEETDCEKCNEKQEDKPEEAKDTVNNNTVKDSNPQIVKYDSINDVLKKILGK